MNEWNVDSVESIMDNMQDIKADQEEINEVMARNYDIEVEDEELDAGNFLNL